MTETMVAVAKDEKLGDRVVAYLAAENAQYHAELKGRGWTLVEPFAVGVEICQIAKDLGVPHEAVNGALAHLYQPVQRVVGMRIRCEDGKDRYAIALPKVQP